MFKFITVFVLAIAMVICVVGCGDDASISNPITTREVVASGHPEWPPFMSSIDKKNISGAGVEIDQLLFNGIGLSIKPTYQGNWQEVLDKAKSGDIEVIILAYSNNERKQYMDYSKPICTDPVSLFVASGNNISCENWENLKGLKLVATVGDSYGEEFDKYITNENLNVTRVDSVEEAFNRIDNKEADGFIYSNYAGRKYIHDLNAENKYKPASPDITVQWFYLCISKKSDLTSRMDEINVLIDKYKKDGTIQRIVDKYLNDMLLK